ncbi:hypothetical protein ABZ342_20170 [Amycolatopsis sp. NPDC005961]|uniref:hypothetical protein n=1 Tax=Amycolatopsis sp. NPDC005961 TaxID=3156720 RepID=UPI0034064864
MSRFSEWYGTPRRAGTGGMPESPALAEMPAVRAFLEANHGCEFRSGIYRVHDSRSASVVDSVIQMHPRWSGRVLPFAFDWLGRQFALDVSAGFDEGEAEVLIFEPGTGEVLEVPCVFADFHDGELVDEADAALAESFFEE